jgi:hypothetical protein
MQFYLAEQFIYSALEVFKFFVYKTLHCISHLQMCHYFCLKTRPKVVRTKVTFQCELTALTISDPHRGRTRAVE